MHWALVPCLRSYSRTFSGVHPLDRNLKRSLLIKSWATWSQHALYVIWNWTRMGSSVPGHLHCLGLQEKGLQLSGGDRSP